MKGPITWGWCNFNKLWWWACNHISDCSCWLDRKCTRLRAAAAARCNWICSIMTFKQDLHWTLSTSPRDNPPRIGENLEKIGQHFVCFLTNPVIQMSAQHWQPKRNKEQACKLDIITGISKYINLPRYGSHGTVQKQNKTSPEHQPRYVTVAAFTVTVTVGNVPDCNISDS